MLQGYSKYEGPIQKSLFGFSLADFMAEPVFVRVPRVPFETFKPRDELGEDAHDVMYMITLYNSQGQRPCCLGEPRRVLRYQRLRITRRTQI